MLFDSFAESLLPLAGGEGGRRPDEGVFAGSDVFKSFTALPFGALEIQRFETSGSCHWLQPADPVGTRIAQLQNWRLGLVNSLLPFALRGDPAPSVDGNSRISSTLR